MSDTQGSRSFPLFTEAIVIAAMTFSGYLAVYWYEFGFCIAKGILPMLIRVSVDDVLRSMFITVPLVLILLLLGSFFKVSPKQETGSYLPIYSLAFLVIVAGSILAKQILLPIIWFVALVLLFTQAFAESKAQKRKGFQVSWTTIEPEVPFLGKSVSRLILFVLLISLFLISISFLIGTVEAKDYRKMPRYTLTLKDGKYVFLRRYGDAILLRPLNPEGNELVMVMTFEQLADKLIATERN